jgi:hypothetical protein
MFFTFFVNHAVLFNIRIHPLNAMIGQNSCRKV